MRVRTPISWHMIEMERRGDTHNFGRFVKTSGKNWILKPRSTFWEQLLLSVDSRFRDELDEILRDEPLMDGLPRLVFRRSPRDSTSSLVERVNCHPAINFDPAYLLEALGGLIAVAAWLGMSDLHNQNICVGTDARTGKLLFTPLDIEVIFTDLRLPSLTGILPTSCFEKKMAGLLPLAEVIRNISPRESMAVACAYLRVSQKLLAKRESIVTLLQAIPCIYTEPIRMVMRSTEEYMTLLGQELREDLAHFPLREEEAEQMQRGDVPYFYATMADRRIHYFTSRDLRQSASVKKRNWDHLRPGLLPLDKLFTTRSRNKALYEYGSMMLAAYFLPNDFQGELSYRNLRLQASKHNICLQFRDGILYEGPRDWSNYLVPK